MENLGRKICNNIKDHNQKFRHVEVPDFDGSLSHLTDFLDSITKIDKNFKAIIILDEFDRVSSDLIYQSEVAKSFVLPLRAISNRDQYGFILVGGEKLEYILSEWQEFNKFKPIRVDSFNKKTEWNDFKNLIRYPVKGILEISDKAVDYIYDETAGNPYFTKKICAELFTLMITNRDNHVTENEAKKATEIAREINKIAATDFSHFWKDGIKDEEEKEEEISINRRKVLLSIGLILRKGILATKQQIIDVSIANGLDELRAEKTLDEFVQRKILKIINNAYEFVVKFFEDWLIDVGLDIIITNFQEEQKIILRREYEEQIKVKQPEINVLSHSWSQYKAKDITNEHIRQWLEQLQDIEEQRLIFKIIQNTKVYNNGEIREKMRDLFNEVSKIIGKANKIRDIKIRQQKRGDIIVSYLDKSPVKSGAEYAKIFVEVNDIYKDNAANPDRLDKKINEIDNINTIVFIDDLLGTGESIISNLRPIIENYSEVIQEKEIIVIIGIITGFQKAKYEVKKYADDLGFPIEIVLIDPLNDSDKCFDEDSQIFTLPSERKKSKQVCQRIGETICPQYPLGYGDCQANVVFPNTCPDNTLPILWCEGKAWRPLFKR